MTKWMTPPKKEEPEDIDPLELFLWLVKWAWDSIVAVTMFTVLIAYYAIILFILTCGVILFCQFVVGISNPIPFVEQF